MPVACEMTVRVVEFFEKVNVKNHKRKIEVILLGAIYFLFKLLMKIPVIEKTRQPVNIRKFYRLAD